MSRFFFFVTLIPFFLCAGELHLPLQSVSADGNTGTITTARVEPGVSGFVVRHFSPEHSAIIANAVVNAYDEDTGKLTVSLSPYTGLRQNSLPKGEWYPRPDDEVILAFAYDRGVLIAPDRAIYLQLTKRLSTVEWMHVDTLATFLSYKGHPTPLKEDLSEFCTVATAGLLFLYLHDSLFTIDCQSFALLQISPAALEYDHADLPFYTRVPEIDANWFGAGSDELEAYEPHYFELMVEYNPHSQRLYDYIQSHPSVDKQLLDQFELKSQP